MARAIIYTLLGKSLFERLIINKSANREVIYFNKTTTVNGESNNKIFDVDDTIFYKPFEIEINYDITNQTQSKNTIGFFCCRKENKDGVPTIHVFSVNKKLCIDMCNDGSTQRKSDIFSLNDKGKIIIQYNEGIIKLYYNEVFRNTYDLSNYKITGGLPAKCSVGMSYTSANGVMANGINGTVNVKIKELKE